MVFQDISILYTISHIPMGLPKQTQASLALANPCKFNFDNPFKIGRSIHPTKRLAQLSTGQIYNSKLIYISDLCYDYILADSLLKQHLRKYKINREIYDIPLNDAIHIINHVVFDVNNSIDCRTF